MKALPAYPLLYQINTRVWLTELSRLLGRPATLDDIPDRELDRVAEMGFDWVWLLSVWRTGTVARAISPICLALIRNPASSWARWREVRGAPSAHGRSSRAVTWRRIAAVARRSSPRRCEQITEVGEEAHGG